MKIDYDHQLLSFAETEQQLEELFKPGKNSGSLLRELAQREISPSERTVLIKLKLDLLLLATRANPILRPTVQDYEEIAQLLAVGKRKGAVLRLDRIDALRARIVARMSDIDDYMNWFEATQLKENSGLFVNYVSAAKEQGETHPRWRDPLPDLSRSVGRTILSADLGWPAFSFSGTGRGPVCHLVGQIVASTGGGRSI